MSPSKQSRRVRSGEERNINLYVPLSLSKEIAKIRIDSGEDNSTVITTLLLEALAARRTASERVAPPVAQPEAVVQTAAAARSGALLRQLDRELTRALAHEQGVAWPPDVLTQGVEVVEPPVEPAPLSEIDAQLAAATQTVDVNSKQSVKDEFFEQMIAIYAPQETTKVEEPETVVDDDDEIDIAALAAIEDDERPVLDPFKLVS